jgi:hypothetical protein
MRRPILARVFATSLALLPLLPSAHAANANPRILPPHAKPYGQSYGEWSAAWWQWALSAPASVNPLIDSTGANCAEGQDAKVWYLAGTAGGGTATRSCTIPTGTALFFPIVNTFSAAEGTVEEMRAVTAAFIDSIAAMSVSIDGQSVENPVSYRAMSPVFSLTLPANNIFGVPEGTYEPAVSDGFWLLLAPLPPGEHVIHFSAASSDGSFSLDVTYILTVEAGRKSGI